MKTKSVASRPCEPAFVNERRGQRAEEEVCRSYFYTFFTTRQDVTDHMPNPSLHPTFLIPEPIQTGHRTVPNVVSIITRTFIAMRFRLSIPVDEWCELIPSMRLKPDTRRAGKELLKLTS